MSGRIFLQGEQIIVTFPFDSNIVQAVKTVPGKKWDGDNKRWLIPKNNARDVISVLQPFNFSVDEDVLSFIDSTDDSSTTMPNGEKKNFFTVSQLNNIARSKLKIAMSDSYWVIGELQKINRNLHKTHIFFEMVETEKDSNQPQASVTAVLFDRVKRNVFDKISKCKSPFELKDGLQCMFLVKVDIYPVTGSFQLVVEDIDLNYTLGAMALKREEILLELEKRGIIFKNKNICMPLVPLHIGLISSFNSDGYNDFLSVIKDSGYGFKINLYDSHMQGEKMQQDIINGISLFEADPIIDVIVIVRGGGGAADLSWIDTLEVSLKAASCEKKIVTGIGHVKDAERLILKEITHNGDTPTLTAKILVETINEFIRQIDASMEAIHSHIQECLRRECEIISNIAVNIGRISNTCIKNGQQSIESLNSRLIIVNNNLFSSNEKHINWCFEKLKMISKSYIDIHTASITHKSVLLSWERIKGLFDAKESKLKHIESSLTHRSVLINEKAAMALKQCTDSIKTLALRITGEKERVIADKSERLSYDKLKVMLTRNNKVISDILEGIKRNALHFVNKEDSKVDAFERSINAYSPTNTLKRGFGIIKNINGNTVRTIKDIETGKQYRAVLCDGNFIAEAKEKEEG